MVDRPFGEDHEKVDFTDFILDGWIASVSIETFFSQAKDYLGMDFLINRLDMSLKYIFYSSKEIAE